MTRSQAGACGWQVANPRGFLAVERRRGERRPVEARLGDFREFEALLPEPELRAQASRCMDCGVPFCHSGCPLGNIVPEWNDHVYRGDFAAASRALEATNNFPEMTGRVCPAPCEAACVLNIEGSPVTIKEIERAIGDRHASAPLVPKPASRKRGERVVIVGSGPAGLRPVRGRSGGSQGSLF